jgi:PAS domain-containing protein
LGPEATFSIGEVAVMAGLTPHTIRAWERRHQVVSPGRTPSNHRRYTTEDLQTLIGVRQAVTARRLSLRLATMEQDGGTLPDVLRPPAEHEPATPDAYAPDDWRSAADVLPNLILVLDTRGRIVDANIAVARATGIVRSGLRGRHFADMVDPYDRAKAVKVYRAPFEERRGWALNLSAEKLIGLFAFDCRLVASGAQPLIVAVGHDLSRAPGEGPGHRRQVWSAF